MTYDKEKDRFFYDGQVVRYFKDQVNAENANSFFFEDGVVDVEPIKDANGTLTGLKQSSDADFKARTEKQEEIKSELAAAGITGNSGSFELGDPNYRDDSLDAYATFGISYDKTSDNWMYDGKIIHILYDAGLKQALADLAAWVETGAEPLPSSNYHINVGQIQIADTAKERGGLQPVVHLYANGTKCAHVKAGETVLFTAKAEVPDGAGSLTWVEWSFEGEQGFTGKSEFEFRDNGGQQGTAKAEHAFAPPGTYFAVVRVKSERNGDKSAAFTQIRSIDRVRVVVE